MAREKKFARAGKGSRAKEVVRGVLFKGEKERVHSVDNCKPGALCVETVAWHWDTFTGNGPEIKGSHYMVRVKEDGRLGAIGDPNMYSYSEMGHSKGFEDKMKTLVGNF